MPAVWRRKRHASFATRYSIAGSSSALLLGLTSDSLPNSCNERIEGDRHNERCRKGGPGATRITPSGRLDLFAFIVAEEPPTQSPRRGGFCCDLQSCCPS